MCSEDRLYGCAVYHKELNHHYETEEHQHEHSVQRTYACDVCKNTFRRKFDVMSHQLIHSGQRPYACNVCNKTLSQDDLEETPAYT